MLSTLSSAFAQRVSQQPQVNFSATFSPVLANFYPAFGKAASPVKQDAQSPQWSLEASSKAVDPNCELCQKSWQA